GRGVALQELHQTLAEAQIAGELGTGLEGRGHEGNSLLCFAEQRQDVANRGAQERGNPRGVEGSERGLSREDALSPLIRDERSGQVREGRLRTVENSGASVRVR